MDASLYITRVQTGVRFDPHLLVVLQHAAAEKQKSIGELIEEAILHAFEGNQACVRFSDAIRQQANESFRLSEIMSAFQLPPTQVDDPIDPARKQQRERQCDSRVQVGFKIEKRLLKVLKAVAEIDDLSPGHLLERILYQQFQGIGSFDVNNVAKINLLKVVYGMDYDTHACYRFLEANRSSLEDIT